MCLDNVVKINKKIKMKEQKETFKNFVINQVLESLNCDYIYQEKTNARDVMNYYIQGNGWRNNGSIDSSAASSNERIKKNYDELKKIALKMDRECVFIENPMLEPALFEVQAAYFILYKIAEKLPETETEEPVNFLIELLEKMKTE